MSHLPKRDLLAIISQRHRVLRGRDLTFWERHRDRVPSVDWGDALFFALMIVALAAECVALYSMIEAMRS